MRHTRPVGRARLAQLRRGVPVWLALAAVLARLGSAAAPAQVAAPSPEPTATPSPTPAPLRLEVERQIEKVLDEREKKGLPRFETSVEVVGKSPQAMLARHLREFDFECGPDGGGPPTEAEMRAVRPHPAPYLDFLALAQHLAAKAKRGAPNRFFLYRVRRGTDVSYSVREGVIPDSEFYNTTGTSFEMVEGFPDLKAATAAWRRMERGFDRPAPTVSGSPLPPWSTSPCRPKN